MPCVRGEVRWSAYKVGGILGASCKRAVPTHMKVEWSEVPWGWHTLRKVHHAYQDRAIGAALEERVETHIPLPWHTLCKLRPACRAEEGQPTSPYNIPHALRAPGVESRDPGQRPALAPSRRKASLAASARDHGAASGESGQRGAW